MTVRWISAAVAAILLLATALASVSGFHSDREARASREASAMTQARNAVETLGTTLGGNVHEVARLFQASDSVTAGEFRTFVRPVLRQSGASSIGFLRVIRDRDRRSFESARGLTIRDIGPDGRPRRASRHAEYVVSEYSVRAHPDRRVVGLNLTSDPVRARVLRAAAESREPQATPPITLGGNGRPGIAFYMPVLQADVRGDERVIGYTSGTYRFVDMLAALRRALPQGSDLTLGHRGRSVLALGRTGSEVVRSRVMLGSESFEITLGAPPGGIGRGPAALVGGLVLTLLISLLTSAIASSARNARRLAQSRERERDLVVAQAEDRFQRIFESAPAGMALLDLEGRFHRVNPALGEMLGREPAELIGRHIRAVTPEEDLGANAEPIAAMLRGERRIHVADGRFVRADQTIGWAAQQTTVLPGVDGEPELILLQVFDIAERRSLEQQLQHQADHDALTGLFNRRFFHAAVAHHMALARRYRREGALLLIDLDRFKQVNDLEGHQAGDELLVALGAALRDALRDSDTAARIGGDEFAALLPVGGAQEAAAVAERVLAAVRAVGRAAPARHGSVPVTCSIGVATVSADVATAEDLMAVADAAMYRAKRAGGDRYELASDDAGVGRPDLRVSE